MLRSGRNALSEGKRPFFKLQARQKEAGTQPKFGKVTRIRTHAVELVAEVGSSNPLQDSSIERGVRVRGGVRS